MKYKDILAPYNAWWDEGEKAFIHLPTFHRPVFNEIYSGIKNLRQAMSITGPRRVGKSTLLKQAIHSLIQDGVAPSDIIYYSMDDPALLRPEINHETFFDSMMTDARKTAGKIIYFFIDEIQRFEGWELFIKKYYDLDYNVRFIISGSASSPIFKKSRESLLGRIKDFHILPFSFREYLLFRKHGDQAATEEIRGLYECGQQMVGMHTSHPLHADLRSVNVQHPSVELRPEIELHFKHYLIEGGFPEVWSLPDWETKQSYLYDNQVKKVILEDLVLAVEIRKPENLKKFYISLLEKPGQEINFKALSKEIGVNEATIQKYFPLLEMTDLLRHVEKFSKSLHRVRKGNVKCYLVDLALRNAIMRVNSETLIDPDIMGFYAENLVFNALKKWQGTMGISYFREKNSEIDFIVHMGSKKFLPVEVKYRNKILPKDLNAIANFVKRNKFFGMVVTKQWEDVGWHGNFFYLPLPHFLLLFD